MDRLVTVPIEERRNGVTKAEVSCARDGDGRGVGGAVDGSGGVEGASRKKRT